MMYARIVLFIEVLLFISGNGKLFAGPYQLEFKRLYLCEDVGDWSITFSTKLSKVNRTCLIYSSNVSFPQGFRDDMKVTIDVSIFGNGGWQKNYFNMRFEHACSDVQKMFPGLVESFTGAAGYKFTGCPLPSDNFEIKNWIFNIHLAMKIMPYGKYKADVTVFDDGKIRTCFVLEVDLIPVSTNPGRKT